MAMLWKDDVQEPPIRHWGWSVLMALLTILLIWARNRMG